MLFADLKPVLETDGTCSEIETETPEVEETDDEDMADKLDALRQAEQDEAWMNLKDFCPF